MARPEIDMRFDRSTQSARDVLTRANDVSTHYGQNFIDTTDLFLGIINGPEDDPALVLLNGLGPDVVGKARFAVEILMVQGRRTRAVVGLTERAKGTIELAREEADRLHSHPIRSEHILLGIIRTEEGVVAGVLESLGVGIDKARKEAEKLEAERRAGQEDTNEKATPLVRELIKLHHPDWSLDAVEELTPIATPAIVDLIDETLDLPKDPDLREPLFQQALDRFRSRFSGFLPPPKVE